MIPGMENLLGIKVTTTDLMPGDMVIVVRDGETLMRYIWTANALADQEIEIERLRSLLALAEQEVGRCRAPKAKEDGR